MKRYMPWTLLIAGALLGACNQPPAGTSGTGGTSDSSITTMPGGTSETTGTAMPGGMTDTTPTVAP